MRDLYCSHNQLQDLPESLEKLHHLQALACDGNQL
ncbi:hypothetical protein IC235_07290 [Hymenobacter sp. BT664]|uniref:Leucine-rich repeat domain-containing protein n=1 Tax=Hymenobacter montanus TaxID=2771359 RepID=A0A927GJ18_9BACT|nr:hypothetical protein [Hymenobacter montanus]